MSEAVAAVQSNGAAPPPQASDVGSVRTDEGSLIKQALAELDGAVPQEQVHEPDQVKQPEPKKPEELTQKKLSDGFAKLAAKEDRHERRVAAETAKLQAERAAFEAERAEVAPLKEARERAKSSPLEALQLLGWNYKELVDYVMADGKIPPEKFAQRLDDDYKKKFADQEARINEINERYAKAQEQYEAQQDMNRVEHQTRELFKDGGGGLEKFPTFAYHFRRSPENAQKLLVDVQNLRTRHFNETCQRDPKTGQIIRPGEIVDALPAVAYIERILADIQISTGNPGQPGAALKTANADAARQAPKPLTPRDSSVTSMPSDEELSKMSQEELDALSLRVLNGG